MFKLLNSQRVTTKHFDPFGPARKLFSIIIVILKPSFFSPNGIYSSRNYRFPYVILRFLRSGYIISRKEQKNKKKL